MRPAFSSTQSAAAFALLLLLLLALPVVVGKNWLPPREQIYENQGWVSAPYPWIHQQIFEETNDIDIAFVGSSHIFNAINTPYVQAKLSERLGRPAVVRTIAWGGAGYDALYLIAQDLLAHRKVQLLVFYDENGSVRNSQIPILFRFADDAAMLPGLSASEQGLFYFAAMVGMPRNLLCLLRPNLPAPLVTYKPNFWEIVANGPGPTTRLGSLAVRRGFVPDPTFATAPFEPFKPETPGWPADALVYSMNTKTNFEFSSGPIPPWHLHFARQFAALLHEYKVQPVMLYLPALAEIRSPVIRERTFWPEIFPSDAVLLGIPPAKLFGTLTDADVRKLYGDPNHFNQNGQEYFTRLITPQLINLYETQSSR